VPYINRNSQQAIIAISLIKSIECSEWVDDNNEGLKLALVQISGGKLESIHSDLAMVRVIEDLIDILVTKSIISLSEFPQSAQLKLLARDSMRKSGDLGIGAVDLIRL
jgi:hypothetical protein